MTVQRSALFALALAVSAGCATPAPDPASSHRLEVILEEVGPRSQVPVREPEVSTSTRFVDAGLPRVWGALLAVYADLQVPVNVVAAAEGRIGNSGYRAGSIAGMPAGEFLDCGDGDAEGDGGGAEPLAVALRLETSLRSRGRGTQVVTELEAVEADGHRCVSTGSLERVILERLEAHLWPGGGSGGFPPGGFPR